MTRRAAKVDVNQAAIVEALRAVGAKVADTSGAGKGFPDLVVQMRGVTLLVEVKDGDKKWKLTPAQEKFHKEWEVWIVESPEQAVELVSGQSFWGAAIP